jgi:uncharacterized protein (DUF2141 family)
LKAWRSENQTTILTLEIMKSTNLFLAIIFIVLTGFRTSNKGALVLSLSNITKTGSMNVALYKEGEDFPDDKYLVKSLKSDCATGVCKLQFENVEYGQYAIAIYQDVNGNGKLDTGNFGVPKEPFAFSNNFRPKWGGPSFDKCKFQFSKDKQVIEIALINSLFGKD